MVRPAGHAALPEGGGHVSGPCRVMLYSAVVTWAPPRVRLKGMMDA